MRNSKKRRRSPLRVRIGALAVPVLAFGCTTSTAREAFENEARGELQDHYNMALAAEWSPMRDYIFGTLSAEREDTVALAVDTEEEIGVLGSCDGDCGDLNLVVFGPEWGPWARDMELPGEGKYPFAFGRARETGTYRVIVTMPNCQTHDCYYALWFLRRTP